MRANTAFHNVLKGNVSLNLNNSIHAQQNIRQYCILNTPGTVGMLIQGDALHAHHRRQQCWPGSSHQWESLSRFHAYTSVSSVYCCASQPKLSSKEVAVPLNPNLALRKSLAIKYFHQTQFSVIFRACGPQGTRIYTGKEEQIF